MNPWLIGAALVAAAFLLLRGGPSAQAGGTLPAADGTTVPGGSDATSGASPGGPDASPFTLPAYFSGQTAVDQSGQETVQDYNAPGGSVTSPYAPVSYIGPTGAVVTPVTYQSLGATPQPILSSYVAPPQPLGGFPGGGSLGGLPNASQAPRAGSAVAA